MPKVSEQHWRAQEQRFLDAARRCFTRIGVAPASMEEIRVEAGVSAGAMYRYFASKDALVHAAIETSMTEFEAVLDRVAEHVDATGPLEFLCSVLNSLRDFRYHTDGVDLFRLAIQGWAHAQSRPETRSMLMASLQRQLAIYARVATRWTSRANAHTLAAAIGGAVIGYVVQSTFSDDDIDPKRYCKGFSGLD
jgi:TetR/AcrR family transcriptional regulator, transcriptional repressor of aconitase